MSTQPSAASASPSGVTKAAVRQVQYRGSVPSLASLQAMNLLLTVVTLGIYHFWAKTKVRQFFHDNTLFMDEPFSYLGSGREICFSALRFIAMVVLPAALLFGFASFILQDKTVLFFLGLAYAAFFMAIKFYARLSGLRYRANRMSWRGVRFTLKVKRGEYLDLMLKVLLLNIVTLGLYRPHGDARLLDLFINRLHYGTLPFTYRGDKRGLTRGFFFIWLLIPLTFGASLLWYRARLYRHIALSTRLGPMEFRYNISGGTLFWLGVTNWLLWIVSFGLLGFYAAHRQMQLFAATLRLRDLPDLAAIRKSVLESDHAGAADYFGVDEDLGF